MQKMMGLMRKCIDDYHMISPGDKIAVGVSGGKDSLTLLTVLAALRSYYPAPFELTAITIDMGLGGMDFSPVEALCRSLDVGFYCKKTEIGPIIFDYRKEKNPCSMCAKMRRGALHSIAKAHGCNKVALGHHLDDALETFLMSLTYEGRIHTFAPRAYLSRADITLIRPMIYVLESDIIDISRKLELPIVINKCPADGHTSRQDMKDLLNLLSKDNPLVRQRMQSAMTTGLWQKYLVNAKGDEIDALTD